MIASDLLGSLWVGCWHVKEGGEISSEQNNVNMFQFYASSGVSVLIPTHTCIYKIWELELESVFLPLM